MCIRDSRWTWNAYIYAPLSGVWAWASTSCVQGGQLDQTSTEVCKKFNCIFHHSKYSYFSALTNTYYYYYYYFYFLIVDLTSRRKALKIHVVHFKCNWFRPFWPLCIQGGLRPLSPSYLEKWVNVVKDDIGLSRRRLNYQDTRRESYEMWVRVSPAVIFFACFRLSSNL